MQQLYAGTEQLRSGQMQPGPSQSELPLQGFTLEVPRDGNEAWKSSSRSQRARLRASSHRQSRLMFSGLKHHAGQQAPNAAGAPAAGDSSRARSAVRRCPGAAGAERREELREELRQPRAQHPPGMPSERAGRKVQEQPGKVPPYARSGQTCVAGGGCSRLAVEGGAHLTLLLSLFMAKMTDMVLS